MKKTLEQLNNLVELGVIEKYAIGGGVLHIFTISNLRLRMTLI